MKKIDLSPKQEKIVSLKDGAYLILATAGSGKTRVLTERIKRLSQTVDKKILAITFTNKAANELKERIGTTEKIEKSVFVGTFHSFCQSILELRFKLLGYNQMPHIFEDDADRLELIKQAIKSVPFFEEIYNKLEPKKRNEYVYNALQFISTVKRELISAQVLAEKSKANEYQYLYETYQDILKSNNAIDFDDIIRLIYELFTDNQSIANLYRNAYKYVCIDECQDLNKLQYFFLKAFCGSTINNVMMVGDPNQAIYGFNGATTSFMQEDFINDFQAKKISLKENYRCSKSIIEASNTLMKLNVEVNNYVKKGIFQIYAANSESDEAEFVVDKIMYLINLKSHDDIEGNISYDKITILARNKYVFAHIEMSLKMKEIPYYYKSGITGIKFNSPLMKIFYLFFRVKINPLDKLHQKRLEDILNISDVNSSIDLLKSKYPNASAIKTIVNDVTMDNLHLKLIELEDLFRESNIKDDDEKKMTFDELIDFSNHLTRYKSQNIYTTLDGFKSAIALGLTNSSKKKNVGICLSTVHTMKGQESEIVFLIGMDEGTLPDYRAIKKGGEALQQELNNTYVAFTRAKRFLYITYPKKRNMPWGDIKNRDISRFLKTLV